jgi:hypothetical protein
MRSATGAVSARAQTSSTPSVKSVDASAAPAVVAHVTPACYRGSIAPSTAAAVSWARLPLHLLLLKETHDSFGRRGRT